MKLCTRTCLQAAGVRDGSFGTPWLLAPVSLLAAVLLTLAAFASSAHAAVAHEFLAAPSAAISKGVPAGCGGSVQCLPGPLGEVSTEVFDGGHLRLAERIGSGPNIGRTRVDQFDGSDGTFVPPQLGEQGGLTELRHGVAVGHAGGEEQVYVGAGDEGRNVVAVFGSTGDLQPEGLWAGKGTPSGSFKEIRGVAVSSGVGLNQGDVYVAEGRFVDVFAGEAGGAEPTATLAHFKLTAGTGAGTLEEGTNTVKGVSTATGRFAFGQEVEGAGIPAGTEITAVTQCGEPAEPCLEISQSATATGAAALTTFGEPEGIAVSPINGDVFVSDGGENECGSGKADCVVDVFEPTPVPSTYNLINVIKGPTGEPFKGIRGMSVDGNGDLYVVEGVANVVDQFDDTGTLVGRLTGTPDGEFHSVRSVATDPESGDVYVGDYDPVQEVGAVDVFGPSRVTPDVATTGGEAFVEAGPNGEGLITASLDGSVDPLSEGAADCQFAFGLSEPLENIVACEKGVAEGNAPVEVSAAIASGLEPGTRYLFRLQASNKNGTNPAEASDDRELLTPGPGIRDESVADVSATAATLHSEIDPNGARTSFFFEYGKSTAYESQAPAAPGIDLGAGAEDISVPSQHIQSLAPATLYHYRVVALSTLAVHGGGEQQLSFAGPDRTFKTASAAPAALPDNRRWELVTPPDKHGAVIEGNNGPGAIRAAADGSAITYVSTSPTEADLKGTRGQVQNIATRSGGWTSHDISVPHKGPVSVSLDPEFSYFSTDLSNALFQSEGEEFTSLEPEVFPQDTERGLYVRHNSVCGETPSHCYQPLLVGCPPSGEPCPRAVEEYADVPPGTKFGGDPNDPSQNPETGPLELVGTTRDLSHIVVATSVALNELVSGEQSEMYEISPGATPEHEVQLVSLTPDEEGNEAPAERPSLGKSGTNTRNAISEDGSRVVFSGGGSGTSLHLYVRDVADSKTLQIDQPQPECIAASTCGERAANPEFQIASQDGSHVLFTDTQRLTADAGDVPGEADLYDCALRQVGERLICDLTDLTPSPGAGKAAAVLGSVIGASEDASWVYFVANGVLGDAAERGAGAGDCAGEGEGQHCNLYVSHEGSTHLIAVLSAKDFHSWTGNRPGQLGNLTGRVSPNGRYLAFMSQKALTGYDNRDVQSNQPDQEVFIYHAETAQTGTLACASCDPTGARPRGAAATELGENSIGFKVWEPTAWIAASVPVWTSFTTGRWLTQPRYLSDEGRLFFNSRGALSGSDVNDSEDVYEFEPAGVGDCSSVSLTFYAVSGGCLALISSGRAAGESDFIEASESGDDVFFLTSERLVSKDVDTSSDLYDAHVCSSEAPCPEEVEPPANCVTAEACRAAPVPQPGIFGAPSSATFSGAGNIAPRVAKVVPKAKVLTRAQKLTKALKACRAKHDQRQRKSCARQARKRYGPPPSRARKGGIGQSTGSRGGR